MSTIASTPPAAPPPHHSGWRWWLWVIVAVVAIIVIVGAGLWLLLHNGTVHRYVLNKARTEAAQALGGAVEIGDYQLHLSGVSPTVDVYNLVIPGTPLPEAQGQPLLRIAHVRVGVQVTSLWHRAWHIADLEIDHPVVHFVQTADGRTNLPAMHPGNGPGPDLFNVGIRHAVVRQGEVVINSRPSELSADLREVHFQTSFDPATRRYTGALAYDNGAVQVGHYRSIPHALALNFTATPAGAEISNLVLTSKGSRVQANATVSSYHHPVIHANYQFTLDAGQLRSILRSPDLPSGTVAIAGAAALDSAGAGGFLDRLQAQGQFSSPQLQARVGGLSTPVRALAGHYQLTQGTLEVTPIRAQVAGGALAAQLQIRDLATTAAAQVSATIKGARLEQVVRYAGTSAATLGQAGVSGTVDATAHLRWSGSLEHVTADVNATLAAAIAGAHAGATPVTGTVQARFSGDQLTLTSTRVQTSAQTVTAQGTLTTTGHGRAAIQIHWQTQDLAETEALVDHVLLGINGSAPPPLGLAGAGSFTGTLSGALNGTTAAPVIAGELALQPFTVRGTHWRSVRAGLTASPSEFRIDNGALLPATGNGRIALTLNAGLSQWSYHGSNPVALNVNVAHFPMRQLAPLLEPALGRPVPLDGRFDLQASVHGSGDNPLGQGTFRMAPARFDSGSDAGSVREPIRSLQVDFQGSGAGRDAAITAQITAVLPAGTLTGRGTYLPRQNRYQAELHSTGINLAELETVQRRKIDVHGAMAITAQGAGLIADPEFDMTLAAPRLQLQGQTITGLSLSAHLADHAVHAVLASSAVDTVIQGEATVQLSGEFPATARLDTQTISLATALAAFAPTLAADISGHTEVHATLNGPLKIPEQVQAHLTLPVLQVDYDNTVHVAAAAPVHIDLVNGVATVQPFTISGTDTHVEIGGSIPVADHTPIKVTAVGTVDLRLIQAFAPDLTTSGEARLNLNASGPIANPAAAGEIQITNASITNPDWPVGVQNANGVLRLSGDRLNVASFSARVGGGTLTASGGVVLRPTLTFDLGIRADQVRLQFPPTVRETLGATLALSGTPEQATLAGRVRVEDVSVTPQFDFTQVLSQFNGVTTVAPPGSFTQNLSLNIAVTTPNQIRAVSRDFSLQASANVTVRGTAAEPAVLGRVNITSGDLIFRGDRYVLSSGTLDFINPSQIQPVVNISADTTIQQYNLHLHFQGPASNLRTSYTSDPALPPADIINLLAFGTTTEASAANPSPGNLGAENLIASAVSSQITDRVQKIAGISQLSVDPVLGGAQQNPGARITVQQRVTANLFVTISTDVTSTQRDVIEIQYQVSPTVSVSAVRDQNGGLGVNTRFKKTW